MGNKLRRERDRPRYLLVTSSVAALLIGAVVPSALARTHWARRFDARHDISRSQRGDTRLHP